MDSKSTMSSVSFSHGCEYDVFLNFRGSDTRHAFISHLYRALCDKGIRTFIDDEELQRGEEITPSLLKAIQESRIAIPVLSQNYASSTFCLDELVHILACSKEKGRLVLPVFYDVDPSHVRHQRGTYQEALNTHQHRFHHHHNKLQEWRNALRQVADLSGYHFKHGSENECEFIRKIVKEVSQKVNRTLLDVAEYPVGLESRTQQVNWLSDIESGVHTVGIYGVGVGKTIAKAIHNFFADQVDGLVHLKGTLHYETIGENEIKLGSVSEGILMINHRLHIKKVLSFPVIWKPPPVFNVKANFKVLFKKGQGAGMGVVFRDHHGDILESATCFLPLCMEVTITEALCFRWVLQLAEESYSCTVVILESDCQIAEKMLNGEYALTEELNDCYNLLSPQSHGVSFVRREANLLARKLASLAFVYDEDMHWTNDIPYEARPIAIMDVSALRSNCDTHYTHGNQTKTWNGGCRRERLIGHAARPPLAEHAAGPARLMWTEY